MVSSPPGDVTRLLPAPSVGDRDALEDLGPVVYAGLRRMAARSFRHERPGHTLQPTVLVHEAYLKLVDQRHARWQTSLYPEQGRLVELRYFGGLTIEETAEAIGLSSATVTRQWTVAQAWPRRDLKVEATL